jgi:hypothetical protein
MGVGPGRCTGLVNRGWRQALGGAEPAATVEEGRVQEVGRRSSVRQIKHTRDFGKRGKKGNDGFLKMA